MLIFGIDPGIGITGYSLVEFDENKAKDNFSLITSGSIQTDKKAPHPKRLLELKNDMDFLIKKYKPDCASIEQLFFFKNQKTIIEVGQARGVITLVGQKNRLNLFSYTPLQVKKTVTGKAKADKEQVAFMVKKILGINKEIKPLDITDAIAIALTHANNLRIN